jgi:CHASE2 domain-containing sensor protein
MNKRAVLDFNGSLAQGFHVKVSISEGAAQAFTDAKGTLPPASDLLQLFTRWQAQYLRSLGVSRIALESISVQTGTLAEIESCKNIEKELEFAFKKWLKSLEFQPIDQKLRDGIQPQEAVEILLSTTDKLLHRLPWHCWDFIEDRSQAELMVESPRERISLPTRNRAKVRILAILGDCRGIDPTADRLALESLPDAEIVFLVERPRQEVYRHLWEESWDILFFAGHSKTEQEQGRIYLNASESFTLKELRFGLKRAISNGLQLAIFNSCDGLGLAYELEQLHIPQLIVMREPVPDRVAQDFLKQFLGTFSTGTALHVAVRQARESLQGLEGEFPAASWLPIVFQNPAVPSLTWQGLQGHILPRPTAKLWKRVGWAIGTSIAVTGLLLGIRHTGLLQSAELNAFDIMLQLRPAEPPDPRIAIVTVTEDDIKIQKDAKEPSRGSLSDRSLAQLLDRLESAHPTAIGLDIYRDYPVSKYEPKLALRLHPRDSESTALAGRIVGVCKVADTEDAGVAPPPELDKNNLGFSDILRDPDKVVRRHYLALTPHPASFCQAPYALSVQLALRYLETKKIRLEVSDKGDIWKLGKSTLSLLENHSGGYQQIDSGGSQILLNYRATSTLTEIAHKVTLKEVLNGQINPDIFKGKIVLIGTTAKSFGDVVSIPYGANFGEIPGVVLQAQMVSQLLSAALDGRPLIQTNPAWSDALWVWGSAVTGGLLVLTLRHRPVYLGVAGAGAISLLFGACILLLQSGVWVAFIPAAIAIVGTGSMTKLVDRSMNHEI